MQTLFDAQRAAFEREPFPELAVRRERLRRLEQAVRAHKADLMAAVNADYGHRARHETEFGELYTTLAGLRHARRHLGRWMRARRRHVDWPMQPGRAWIQPQPLGVVGIVSPWNYPLFLTLGPLTAALAAGNRVMIKPSEFTPRTSAALHGLLAATFDNDLVAVVQGDAEAAAAFVALDFDHLLFTGSTRVGQAVMRAAAERLTPVTLELGGKSPALVAPDADLASSADDIVHGKLFNAGQTCVAPDYALVPRASCEAFVDHLKTAAKAYYPKGAADEAYTAIINTRQQSRLTQWLADAEQAGARCEALFGTREAPEGKLAPVAVLDAPTDGDLMREEIFGPILPIIAYDTLDDAIAHINRNSRPLALYLFTDDAQTRQQVLRHTVSGGVTLNDTLAHVAIDDLPFGGVGASGMGRYHGREGFETFSHMKSVFQRRGPRFDRKVRPPASWLQRLAARWLTGG